MKLTILLIGTLLSLSCITGCTTIKYNYPSDIQELCESSMGDARECIENNGLDLKEKWGCSIIKNMNCERKATSGYWCWYEPRWKMWVGGLYGVREIEIGCNPRTGKEVSYDVLKHECGHHWLTSNVINGNHPIAYKQCFINWNDPIRSTTIYTTANTYQAAMLNAQRIYKQSKDGDWISVEGIDENGDFFQIDFIVISPNVNVL